MLSNLAHRYPFLPDVEEEMLSVIPSLRDLTESPLYAEARESGRFSLRQAAVEPSTNDATRERERLEGETRFLSFHYSRLLLSMPGLPPALTRRWCLSEAKSAWMELCHHGANVPEIIFLAERLGFSAEREGEEKVGYSLPSYVRMAAPIREVSYRLAGQEVRKGIVFVGRERAARLLQEAIRLHLLHMPSIVLSPALVELLSKHEGKFLEEVARLTPSLSSLGKGLFNPSLFPPCVREMMAVMARGENLSHFGRFTLSAYLHKVGADPEYIVDCYRGAPDFDEEITRYQVEHITTHDSGEGYTPPECATIVANGLCFKERDETRPSLCADPTLKHPLNYYRRRRSHQSRRQVTMAR